MKGLKIPTVVINKAQDLQPPLDKSVEEFLDSIMKGARDCFDRDNEVMPLFFMKDGDQTVPMGFKELTPEVKQAFYKWMHTQIPLHDACIFVVETWFASALKSETKDGVDDLLLMPSQRADRREMVMIHLFTPTRRVTIVAEITRKPNKLGPWERFEDTDDKGSIHVEGPMINVPFTEKIKQ